VANVDKSWMPSRRSFLRFAGMAGALAAFGAVAACAPATSTSPTVAPATTSAPAATTDLAAPTSAPAAATTAPAAPTVASAAPTTAATTTAVPATAPATASKEAIKLTFLDLAVPSWKPVHGKILDMFEAKNPNIKIDRQAIPFAEYIPKLTAEFVAGDAPDVHFNIGGEILKFAKDKHLMSLEPYVKSGELNLKEQYDSLDVIPFRYPLLKGDLYALGCGNVLTFVGYNKKLFDEAGVPYPDNLTWDPQTGGTLVETAKKLTKTDASGNITQYGLSWYSHPGALGAFIWSNGGEVLNEQQTSAKPLMDDAPVEAIQFLSDLVNKYKVSYLPGLGIGSAANLDPWPVGKLAMSITHAWGGWTAIKDFEWDIAPIPAGPKGQVPYGGADHYSAWAKTKYPDQTFQLLKWDTGPETQAMRYDLWPAPTYQKLTQSKDFLEHSPPPKNRKIIDPQLAKAKQFYFVPPWSAWTNVLLQEVGLVYRQQKSAKDALTTASKKIDDLITATPL
jgi:multiple sugar transport system substrate-binding protein